MRNIDSLKNSAQFKEVYNKGKSVANKLLVLYVYPQEGSKKLGISVSKKVGNSVVRHRTTRLIRQSYVALKDKLPDGFHFVVIARSDAAGKKQQDMNEALENLFKMQGLV